MPEAVETPSAAEVSASAPLLEPKPKPADELAAMRAKYEIQDEDDDTDLHEEIKPVVPEVAEVVEPPKLAPSKHSKLLVNAAKRVGLTEADLEDASPEDIRLEIQTRQQEAVERAKAVVAKAPEPDEELDWGEIDDEDNPGKTRKIREDEVAPGIVKQIKKLASKQKELDAAVAESKQFVLSNKQAQANAQIDAVFAGLKNPLFGAGGIDTLTPNGPEHTRRRMVMQAALAMPDSEGLDARIVKAAKLFAVPAAAAPAEKTETPAEREWKDAGLAHPTSRKPAAEPKGTKAAVKAVAKRMGVPVPADDPDDDGGY